MDEDEFEAFYGETRQALRSYLVRLAGAFAADDILQDAYIRFFNQPPAGREERAMKSYLFTIATRLAYDRGRRAGREASRREDEASRPSAGESAVATEDPDLRRDVGRALDTLSTQERSLVWLAHVEQYGHREIAGILGLGEKSVRVLLFRARRRLVETLDRMGLRPSDREEGGR
jgi:RNA polymerase sigma-70 factor (ECF subfamily)